MSLKREVAHGLKWQAISIGGSQLLSLVVVTTLARLLEPSAFGLVSLIGVYLGFVTMLVDQGIVMALIQRKDLRREHIDAAFWFNLGCALLLCLSTVVLAGSVASLLNEPRLVRLLRWSSLGLVIGASSEIHATLFTKAMDFRRPVIRGLIGSAVGGTVGVGMALGGCGVWSLVGQQLAGAGAGAVFLWSMSTYRPSLRVSLPHLRELFGLSSSAFVISMLWYFASRFDQIVIGRFAGTPALGLYAVAGKLPNLAKLVSGQPVATVALPTMSRLQGDHGTMRRAIYQGMELNAVVSFAVFVGIAATASDLMAVLFGGKWGGAAMLCSLLSLYSLVEGLQVFCYPALLATAGIRRYVGLCVCKVAGVAVVSLVGIQFGVAYVVAGLTLNSLVFGVPGLVLLRKRIGLSPLEYCKPCLAPALASLIMVGVIRLMSPMLPAGSIAALPLACKALVGASVYVGCLLLLDPAVVKKLGDTIAHAFRRHDILRAAALGSAAE